MKTNSIIMKTTTLFLSKLAAIAVVPVLALTIAVVSGAFTDKAMAQNPSGGSSNSSYAVGGFTTLVTGEHVAFAAQNIPKKPGTYAGYVVQQFANGTTNSGNVTCLGVFSGNVASISFYVRSGPDAGLYRTFLVQDNGEPSAVTMSTDLYKDCGESDGNCDCLSGSGFEALLNGNIVVNP